MLRPDKRHAVEARRFCQKCVCACVFCLEILIFHTLEIYSPYALVVVHGAFLIYGLAGEHVFLRLRKYRPHTHDSGFHFFFFDRMRFRSVSFQFLAHTLTVLFLDNYDSTLKRSRGIR